MKKARILKLGTAWPMLAGVLWAGPSAAGRQAAPAVLPAPLGTYVTGQAGLTADQQKALLDGKPVTRLLDTDPSKECRSSAPCGSTRRSIDTSRP